MRVPGEEPERDQQAAHHPALAVEDFVAAGDNPAPAAALGASGGGYGLTGMRERAELLGGTLTAAPTGRGFRVVLRVPA
jgi:nitrate/nitrite-specific signal transduction histidine kinase